MDLNDNSSLSILSVVDFLVYLCCFCNCISFSTVEKGIGVRMYQVAVNVAHVGNTEVMNKTFHITRPDKLVTLFSHLAQHPMNDLVNKCSIKDG